MSENGTNMYMPVAPMGNYYGNGGNDGMFGGGWMWFLLVWMAMFGWGGNGNGWGGNDGTYSEVQRGFDQNSVMTGIQGIQNTLTNGFAQAEAAASNRQMADMNQYFQMQNSFQQCLTKIRNSIKRFFNTKYIFANGTCAS